MLLGVHFGSFIKGKGGTTGGDILLAALVCRQFEEKQSILRISIMLGYVKIMRSSCYIAINCLPH